jgi:hypothetical protein
VEDLEAFGRLVTRSDRGAVALHRGLTLAAFNRTIDRAG